MDLIGALAGAAGAGGEAGNPWDISAATYNGSPVNWFNVGGQDTTPEGLFFKDDGTKMYVVGRVGDSAVYEYDLSIAWNFSSASYLQSFLVNAQEANPTGLFFKTDGTKMFVVGLENDSVYEYSLSTAWDVSSASYVQSYSVASQDSQPFGIYIKSDGTKLFVVGVATDSVYEYTLNTAWSLSSVTYVRSFSVSAQETSPEGLFFKDDGTKMYVTGISGDDVNEYALSTAWNISTASFTAVTAGLLQNPSGVFFKSDGSVMYLLTQPRTYVAQYDLSTDWDVTSLAFNAPTTNYFNYSAEETAAEALFFKPDGTKMYLIGRTGDDVNEYNLSTAWDISSASYVQAFSVNAQDSNPFGLFFKPDGTKMYMCGSTNDAVYEYSLSTAWDVSSASYVQNFSTLTQEGAGPLSVFFKDDGTKMYITGSASDSVHEYDLSTAWDISSASFLQSLSVASQTTEPAGLFLKPDGKKMYISDGITGIIYQYDLSTAWDISSSSYVQNLSVATFDLSIRSLFFKDDGTQLYVVGNSIFSILSFDL